MKSGRKYGDRESHSFPIWNGVFEHYIHIGDAFWEFAWCIDKITEESNGVGVVLGGSPVKLEKISSALKGSRKETVRRHMNWLEKGKYIRRRRTPYGHVIEVLNSCKFDIWKRPKEKPQNDVSPRVEKPIHESEKPTGGSEKPKNNTNKEEMAGTKQKDTAVRGGVPTIWKATGVDPSTLPGAFRELCQKLWPTRNGASLFEFMGTCLDGWEALGNRRYPGTFCKAKAELEKRGQTQSSTVSEVPELEELPWRK